MSEIFNWLKRTEFGKRKASMEPSVSSAVLLSDDSDSNDDASIPSSGNSGCIQSIKETPTPADQPALDTFELRCATAIDLNLADYRIKSALDPGGLVGEQFRLLRTSLSKAQKQRNIKSLLITSAAPSEGKTFVACSLSGVLAQEPGKRVLLVDADLRRSNAARALGINGNGGVYGLSDVLRGKADPTEVLISFVNSPLFLLPAGGAPENPAELLSSELLQHSLRVLSERFDWIIVDSPPVIALSDANIIAPLCDAVLLVIHSNKTASNLVKESIQRLGREKVCGVVMNRCRHPKSSKYYYKYYHSESGKPQA